LKIQGELNARQAKEFRKEDFCESQETEENEESCIETKENQRKRNEKAEEEKRRRAEFRKLGRRRDQIEIYQRKWEKSKKEKGKGKMEDI
jgi:hypothetical protein